MYSIFIADDEPKIRKGLRRIIESFEMDIIVCGEAADGMTACEKILLLQPDIILLDICMPIKSGLEIIREIKDQLMSSKIIIISGHDEFEYAKEALEMNVYRYLLKPLLKEELEQTLNEAIVELDSELESKNLFKWALEQLEKRKSYLLESFLHDWVNGKLSCEEIEEQCKFYKIEIPSDPFMLTCGINQESTRLLTDKEYQVMRNASIAVLREIGVETGGSNVQFAVNPDDGKLIVIEMNPRVSRSSALASKATGYPIAKVAAQLAVGYTLDEISNDITQVSKWRCITEIHA